MKKKSKICFIIFMILSILIVNVSFATENDLLQNIDVNSDANNSSIDVNYDDEIMLISSDENNLYEGADIGVNSGDIYIMDDNVEITEKNIYGDVYVMGKNVKITSELIDGNIFVMASTAEITSSISGYAFILAEEVTFSGSIDGIYVLANKVDIEENATIRNDVKAACDTFNLKGIINRNLLISSENINIIRENSNANVYGNITYSGNLNADENLIIGKINKVELPEIEKEEVKQELISAKVTDFVTSILASLIIIALIILLFNNKFSYENRTPINYLKDIGIGIGLLILVPIVSIILMITIIGIPISLIAILLYIVFLCIALPVASIEIGNQIFKEKLDTKIKKIFVGLLVFVIIKLLQLLPIIGGLVTFLMLLLGFGITFKKLFSNINKKESIDVKNELIE